MSIKKKIVDAKDKISTVEMEVAIASFFGIRKHIIVPNISWGLRGMHECDLFLIKKTKYAMEVEIKISKSDLLADFNKKHNHSDNRIKEFYYAIPSYLLETCENLIPEHRGIIVCERTGRYDSVVARIHRKTTTNKKARRLTDKEVLKVATLGCMRIWSLKEKILGMINNGK
jgi:hypothetical protein